MSKKPAQMPALDLFRGFEAAARHLSFTRAAEELFITQSAVSRQIQALEQGLGVMLFIRRNRGLSLTAAGEHMLRAVEEALRTLHDAVERIAPDSHQNLVTVTSSIAFCSLWLIPRLAAFRNMRPEVDVRISANNQVLDLDRERIDIGIRYCPAVKAPPGAIRLFGEEILPVCSPALLKDRSRPLVRNLIDEGSLVVPFALGSVTDRAYFIVRTAATAARSEVNAFVDWLIAESAAKCRARGDHGKGRGAGKAGAGQAQMTRNAGNKKGGQAAALFVSASCFSASAR